MQQTNKPDNTPVEQKSQRRRRQPRLGYDIKRDGPPEVPKASSESSQSVVTDFASEANVINEMHHELQSLGVTMLRRMFQIGEQLSRIKDQLPHGAWEQWADDHLLFTVRTARRYIRAFKHQHDALVTADPVLFLEEIQGKAESESDTAKSDTSVRFTENESDTDQPSAKPKLTRTSLPKHWATASADAIEAIEQLVDLQSQYREWLDELPEESRTSELAARLLRIVDLNLDHLVTELAEILSINLP